MDVLTVVLSCLLSIPIQCGIMYVVYSRWILPTISAMVARLPVQIREYTEPFIDEKIDSLSRQVKASSARFQRTVNQAAAALDLDDVDLSTDTGIQAAQEKLSTRYGMDVAIQAVDKLIQSIEARKTAQSTHKGVQTW